MRKEGGKLIGEVGLWSKLIGRGQKLYGNGMNVIYYIELYTVD